MRRCTHNVPEHARTKDARIYFYLMGCDWPATSLILSTKVKGQRMTRTKMLRKVSAVLAISLAGASLDVRADTASVGVSITFEIAPIEIIRNRTIVPAKVRTCEALKAKISGLWAQKTRRPTVACTSQTAMPLIATEATKGALIVRP